MTHPRKLPLLALGAALAIPLVLGACRRDEGAPGTTAPPPAAAPEPAAPAPGPAMDPAPAATVTDVVLGTQAGDGDRVSDPKTAFSPGDRTIIASVVTEAPAANSGELRARWTFQDGQLIEETSERFNLDGPGVTNFHITNEQDWPAGNYRLEVSLDGDVVQTREFTVQ